MVEPDAISKGVAEPAMVPNLSDYESMRRTFRWEDVRRRLAGLPGGGLNIAYEAVDRHASGPRADHPAIRWLGGNGRSVTYSYARLKNLTDRFANLLRSLGIGSGERVFTLLGRVPELYITALGTLKNRSVFSPLFSAFGPEPILQRMARGDAALLVTTERFYRRKIMPIVDRLPSLRYVLLIDCDYDVEENVLGFHSRLATASSSFTVPETDPEDPALLHFTSGTTGMPKGALHVHGAVLTHYITGTFVLDLHPDDIFWCTADPGWVTGTSYGIIAPLLHGVTNVVDEAEFDATRWYDILEKEGVTVWYTAPTAIRRLMRIEEDPRRKYNLSRLRLIHSVGEPLNPEAVLWGQRTLGLPIHDNWWQTETGGIMIANYPSVPIRPGSMGRPLPGVEAAIIRRVGEDRVEVIEEPDTEGELALKKGWPSMFREYLHEEERYRRCFVGDWYITGDLARRDADGYFWFVGRADDIIKTSGHMVGPFEVESALMECPGVAEAAVIGVPEPTIGQMVKAFVVLKQEARPSEELQREIIGCARTRLGPAVAPKQITFVEALPKTRSGKIMRRLLKARELGLPEGDTSTLETDS